MMKLIQSMLFKAALAAAFILPAAAATAAPEPVGEALDGEIVSVYVSGNRPSNPYAATSQTLYVYDNENVRWLPLYKSAATDPILDVAGAAGTSKSLMVAHKSGVARSKDGGKTWDEFTPEGWAELVKDGSVQLAVNPENRKEAVAYSKAAARATANEGSKWRTVNLAGGRIHGISYAGEKTLFAATANGGDTSADLGQSWEHQYQAKGEAPSVYALAAQTGYVYTVAGGKLRGLHLGDSGDQFERDLGIADPATGLAVDAAGTIARIATERELYILDLRVPQSELAAVYLASKPIKHLTAHPRKADQVYFAEGNQLFEFNHAKGSSAPMKADDETAHAPSDSLLLGEGDEAAPAEGETLPPAGDLSAVEASVDALIASQPPVDEVVASALLNSGYKQSEVNRWRTMVRRRNLIPQVRTVLGSSEDELRVYTDGDRQADKVQDFDSWRVELSWDLRKFLFDPDEINIADHAADNAKNRNTLVEEVTKLYYDRLEILLAQQVEGTKVKRDKQIADMLKLKRLNAQLNAMCRHKFFD